MPGKCFSLWHHQLQAAIYPQPSGVSTRCDLGVPADKGLKKLGFNVGNVHQPQVFDTASSAIAASATPEARLSNCVQDALDNRARVKMSLDSRHAREASAVSRGILPPWNATKRTLVLATAAALRSAAAGYAAT